MEDTCCVLHNYYEAIIIISLKHQEVSLAMWVNIEDLNLEEVEHYHKELNKLKELKKNLTKKIN